MAFWLHLTEQMRWFFNSISHTCNCLKVSVSSTWPRTCFTSACKMSKQWILLPDDIAKLNETSATVFGLGIPNGGSSDARKSDTCEKCINWVAWGSYLRMDFVLDAIMPMQNGNGLIVTWTNEYKTFLNHLQQYQFPPLDAPDWNSLIWLQCTC